MKYTIGIIVGEGMHRIYICPMGQLSFLAERLTTDANDPSSPVSMISAMRIIEDTVMAQAKYLEEMR